MEAGFAEAVQLNVVVPLTMQSIVMLPLVSTVRVVEPAEQLVVVLVTPLDFRITVWAVEAELTTSAANAAVASKAPRPRIR